VSAEELGSLRAGWTRVRFGDVVENKNLATRDPQKDGLDRIVGLTHLDSESLPVVRWDLLKGETSFSRTFKAGDVLFGKRRAYQRKVGVADFAGICSGDILVFESRNPSLLQEFLPCIVQSDAFFKHALGTSAGSLSPRTSWTQLARFEFALPPLEEQKRLVDTMAEWNATIDAWERCVRAADDAKRALLSELLTDDSPPALLTDFVSLQPGRQRSPKYEVGARPVRYLRAANLKLRGLDLSDLNAMDFTEDEEMQYSVSNGDVLLVEGGDADKVGAPTLVENLPPEVLCIQNTIIRARPRSDAQVPPRWAYWVLLAMFVRGDFERLATGTKLYHLGVRKLVDLVVPTPTSTASLRTEALEALRLHELDLSEHILRLRMGRSLMRELALREGLSS
jgi:type I restriction enzyme S subunit